MADFDKICSDICSTYAHMDIETVQFVKKGEDLSTWSLISCIAGGVFYGGSIILAILSECCAGRELPGGCRMNNDGESCDGRYKSGDTAGCCLGVAQFLFQYWVAWVVGAALTILAIVMELLPPSEICSC